MKVGIIGGGRLGTCLATYLYKANLLTGITARTPEHSQALAKTFQLPVHDNNTLCQVANVILLTVQDGKIASVAEELVAHNQNLAGKTILHCSGSLGLEPLTSLVKAGAHVGSLHPLQSFTKTDTNLQGVYMAIAGDETAQANANVLAKLLGGNPFEVPNAERAAYHAAACLCSNYAVAIETAAVELMSKWLGNKEAAWQALQPLFTGTATNLQNSKEPLQALTGPIARGDVHTITKHMAVLPPNMHNLYSSLGLYLTQTALTQGIIDHESAQGLTKALAILEDENAKKRNCSNN